MTEHAPVTDLLARAIDGDHEAFNAIVERYMALVVAVMHRYDIRGRDAEDASQTVWLRLLEHMRDIREPEALPGWLLTTTRNVAMHLHKIRARNVPVDMSDPVTVRPPGVNTSELSDELLREERRDAVRRGLAELPPKHRQLLLLLVAEPPLSYEEISRRTGMATGSIGPTRTRALAKLRDSTPLRVLLDEEAPSACGGVRR